MLSKVQDLQPKVIWEHFSAINAIPRASTKEEQIIQYMINFGNSLDLETKVDCLGNVIIKKPATLWKENCDTVVLQGHLDMVHQKTQESNFDFNTQGIEMYIDGDWVKAKGTTLGADNGIGVAAIMAVLSSDDIEHPPIEALFTIDEEMGMTGALGLKEGLLDGQILLNLDSEEDDEITIGCAGGVDVEIDGKYDIRALEGSYQFYEIIVQGLTGGHSGVDIHLNRANAIRVFVDCVQYLNSKINIHLKSVEGGNLTNVIPRECSGVVAIRKDGIDAFKEELNTITKQLKESYKLTDEGLTILFKEINGLFYVMEEESQKEILSGLLQMPNGVYTMTPKLEDLVQSSSNLARINLDEGEFRAACHTRSSVDIERDEMVQLIADKFPNAKISGIGPYPGWTPNADSDILNLAKKSYLQLNGVEPKIKSIHAGLECGIISGVYPNMEMISFGPNILGAHSPEERLQISSTQKFWEFLKLILAKV